MSEVFDRDRIHRKLTELSSFWRQRIDGWRAEGTKSGTEKRHAQQLWSDLMQCFDTLILRLVVGRKKTKDLENPTDARQQCAADRALYEPMRSPELPVPFRAVQPRGSVLILATEAVERMLKQQRKYNP